MEGKRETEKNESRNRVERKINRERNNDNFMENINNTAGGQKDRGEE